MRGSKRAVKLNVITSHIEDTYVQFIEMIMIMLNPVDVLSLLVAGWICPELCVS